MCFFLDGTRRTDPIRSTAAQDSTPRLDLVEAAGRIAVAGAAQLLACRERPREAAQRPPGGNPPRLRGRGLAVSESDAR